ncbi:MAG TPA: PAS domain S-box protein, partial [Terriglobales bacterium]
MPSFPEAFFERLVRSAPDALIVLRAGRIVLVNDRAEQMFGYRLDEVLDRGLEMLVSPQSRTIDAALVVASAKPLAGNDLDLVGLRKDGSEFSAEATPWRFETEEELIAVAIRDMSQRRRAEEGLKARVRQQALVAELGRRALIGIDLQQLMIEAVNLICSTLPVDRCNVLELLPDGRVLFQAGAGWKDGLVGHAATEAKSAIPAAHVLRTQTPVIVEDLVTDERFPDA